MTADEQGRLGPIFYSILGVLVLIVVLGAIFFDNPKDTRPICGWNEVSTKGTNYWSPVRCDAPGGKEPSVSPERYTPPVSG